MLVPSLSWQIDRVSALTMAPKDGLSTPRSQGCRAQQLSCCTLRDAASDRRIRRQLIDHSQSVHMVQNRLTQQVAPRCRRLTEQKLGMLGDVS